MKRTLSLLLAALAAAIFSAASFAQPISGLTAGGAVAGADLFESVQAGNSRKVTATQLKTFANGGVTTGTNIGTSSVTFTVANAGTTGTTINRFAKLTGAPSTAVISAISDTENALGVVTAGAGTTGSATIGILGQVTCDFDAATTAGDYVTISSTTAGKCHDAGASWPANAAVYGRVLSTNGGSGAYSMELMTPDVSFQNAGNGKSRPGGSDTQVQYNSSGAFAGISGATTNGTALTLVAPVLGTPASGTLTNTTGFPITGLAGGGTGVLTALGVNVGSAGAFVVNGGALGTPSSGTLSSATGLPISTGVSGLGTGIATALAVSTGSAGAPVLFNGAGGTPSSLTLTNATGLPVAGGGTGVASFTAYGTIVGGTTTTGALQVVGACATTDMLVGGGTGAVPVCTTTTGTGAPARAGSPTFTGTVGAAGITATGTVQGATVTATGTVNDALGDVRGLIQNSKSAAYTTVLADCGKHLYHPTADTTVRTWTIDSNANVAAPLGCAITFANDLSAGVLTIAITSDTMRLAGGALTGSRTMTGVCLATALKVATTVWIISGGSCLTFNDYGDYNKFAANDALFVKAA